MHRNLITKMSLKQLMSDKSLRCIALCVNKRDVVIDLADSLQLIGMAMMMWASINTDQEDRDMDPRETEKLKLKVRGAVSA